jgi:aspartyl/asparaginyl-tRNA synthetase
MFAVQVLCRARVHRVRGKGKSCFIVLRDRTATIQVSFVSIYIHDEPEK